MTNLNYTLARSAILRFFAELSYKKAARWRRAFFLNHSMDAMA
ncbi:hypothetical protein SAMN02745216_04966 [Desulfatibacillum alkenivorans DSM 16219]|uniref:Uncharacterized protein n=1 Tax=Desulfatibacillum alkenivorans DSM 16219 TaxID=1121393 RepID=A0A1M6ZGZ5_9BACT|nr:hypothetical protein SAMN02745216_04966 [Desulfatibacillum alkenivorans DSM 16219]